LVIYDISERSSKQVFKATVILQSEANTKIESVTLAIDEALKKVGEKS